MKRPSTDDLGVTMESKPRLVRVPDSDVRQMLLVTPNTLSTPHLIKSGDYGWYADADDLRQWRLQSTSAANPPETEVK